MQDIKSSSRGFHGVIGVVDGTDARPPEHEPEAYINRKKFHSINVQVLKKRQTTKQTTYCTTWQCCVKWSLHIISSSSLEMFLIAVTYWY